MKIYNAKVIVSGDVIEVIEYGKEIFKDMEPDWIRTGRSKKADETEQERNREKVLHRARQEIRRTVSANCGGWRDARGRPIRPKFLTLTFAENITDLSTANHEFKLFILRLGNKVGGRRNQSCLKYLAIPEFQKRGAVHYHVIFFNLPYIPWETIRACWRHGDITINAIDKVDNVGAYVSKYLSKDLCDERLKGKKCYFKSKGLLQSEVFEFNTNTKQGKKELESVVETAQAVAKRAYQVEYQSDYLDSIVYRQYTL